MLGLNADVWTLVLAHLPASAKRSLRQASKEARAVVDSNVDSLHLPVAFEAASRAPKVWMRPPCCGPSAIHPSACGSYPYRLMRLSCLHPYTVARQVLGSAAGRTLSQAFPGLRSLHVTTYGSIFAEQRRRHGCLSQCTSSGDDEAVGPGRKQQRLADIFSELQVLGTLTWLDSCLCMQFRRRCEPLLQVHTGQATHLHLLHDVF